MVTLAEFDFASVLLLSVLNTTQLYTPLSSIVALVIGNTLLPFTATGSGRLLHPD